jgi:hypothetical protein
MSLVKMKAILRHKGYRIYSRPYELNIVGLRSKSVVANRFDDEIHVFYRVSALNWNYHVYKATTDPGTYWLEQPMQPQGTAILAEGQYIGSHALGLHRGQYLALVQVKPLSIIRDYDRNAVLDFMNGNKSSGLYGIDIHRANKTGHTKTVDKNSAGCQVFEDADDFAQFITLCEKHKDLYGNHFTYSLIDFRAVRRQNLRYVFSGLGALVLMGLGLTAYYHREKITRVADQINDFFTSITQHNNEQYTQRDPTPDPQGQGR